MHRFIALILLTKYGIFHNSHIVRISLFAQAKNITLALREYHCAFWRNITYPKAHGVRTHQTDNLAKMRNDYLSVLELIAKDWLCG